MFRVAEAKDVPSILRLQQIFYEGEHYPYSRSDAERALRQLIANPSLGRMFVDETGSGYLSLTFGFSLEFGGRDAFVDELYVAASSRGRGLGTEALEMAEETCRAEGIRALHLEVEFENEAARRLYARRGYAQHTRFLMTKRLT